MPDAEYRKTQLQELLEAKLESLRREILGAIETLQHDLAHQVELTSLLRADIGEIRQAYKELTHVYAAIHKNLTREIADVAEVQDRQVGGAQAVERQQDIVSLSTGQWLAVIATLAGIVAAIFAWMTIK